MHSTECCQIRWSVQVAFCEERGAWRAVAHDTPAPDDDVLERMLSAELHVAFMKFGASGQDADDLLAVVAEGETAGQAALAACVKFEHLRAEREFDLRVDQLVDHARWSSRPAPRRTPTWRAAFRD